MSVITKIEQQRNKSRVNIFVDGAFFCGLNKETAIIFKLKEGKEVEEEKLKKIIFESEVKSAFEKSLDYLGRQMYSKKVLQDKLVLKGFSQEVVEAAIKKLEEYKYVDDELFAKQFVQQNTKRSKRILKEKLTQKGVSKDIISRVLEENRDSDEFEICLFHAQKYAKNKQIEGQKEIQKFYASLARKGFDFNTIKKAVKTVINKDFEEENNFD